MALKAEGAARIMEFVGVAVVWTEVAKEVDICAPRSQIQATANPR